jgi:signal transduction histidine kinase
MSNDNPIPADRTPEDPEPAPDQRRPYPVRVPMALLTALGVALALLTFSVVSFLTLRAALQRNQSEQLRTAHDQQVAVGRSLVDDQIDHATDTLNELLESEQDTDLSSPALKQRLLAVGITSFSYGLPFPLTGVGRAGGEWIGVGIEPETGQIGVSRVADGALEFTPYEGGQTTRVEGWRGAQQDLEKLTLQTPEQVQVAGPATGPDGRDYVILAESAFYDQRVWSMFTRVDLLRGLVSKSFSPPEGSHVALVYNPAAAVPAKDGPATAVGSADGGLQRLLVRSATSLDGASASTRLLTSPSGRTWWVTSAPLLPNHSSLVWSYASPATAPLVANWTTPALIVVVTALLILVGAAGFASITAIRLRRLTRQIRDATDPDAVAALATRRDWIIEIDEVATATGGTIVATEVAVRSERERADQLVALHLRTLQKQQREREQIAGQLHDGPLQSVLAIGMLADSDARVNEVVQEAADEIRDLAGELANEYLGPGGVPAKLRATAKQVTNGGQFKVGVTIDGDDPVPTGIAKVIVRAAQELTTNAKKHSGGSRCEISYSSANDVVELVVEDDGSGIPTDAVPDDTRFGLLSVQTQVRDLGGTVDLGRSDLGGAKVVITVRDPGTGK